MSKKAPEQRTRGQQVERDRRSSAIAQASPSLQSPHGQFQNQLGQQVQHSRQSQLDSLALSSKLPQFQGVMVLDKGQNSLASNVEQVPSGNNLSDKELAERAQVEKTVVGSFQGTQPAQVKRSAQNKHSGQVRALAQDLNSALVKVSAHAIQSKPVQASVQNKQMVQNTAVVQRDNRRQSTPYALNQQATQVFSSTQSSPKAHRTQSSQMRQMGKGTSSTQLQQEANIVRNSQSKQSDKRIPHAQNRQQENRVSRIQRTQIQNIQQTSVSSSTLAVSSGTKEGLAHASLNIQTDAKQSVQANAHVKQSVQANANLNAVIQAKVNAHPNDAQSVLVVHSQGQMPQAGRWQKPQSSVELAQVKKVRHEHANEAKLQIDVTEKERSDHAYVLSDGHHAAKMQDGSRNILVQGRLKAANLAQGASAVTNGAAHAANRQSSLEKDKAEKSAKEARRSKQKQNKVRPAKEQKLSNYDHAAVNLALDSQSPRRIHSKFRQRPHIPKGRRRFVHISLWKWCLAIFLLILLAAGGVAYKGYSEFKTIGSYVVPAQTEPYELKDGATVSTVVHNLAGQRYHSLLLDLWVKFNHFNYPVIQKGPYLIDGQKTLSQLLTDMCEGNIIKIKLPTVALIEGMTAAMVRKRLLANPELVQDSQLSSIFASPSYFIERTLVKDAKDVTLLEAIGGTHNSLEGLLMPATYEYVKGQYTTLYLVEKALIKMANFMREHYIERNHVIDDVLSSPYEVLILASLVERESSLDSERPLIAGVFLNRLRANIKLQTDPAVMYGVSPEFKGPLRLSQLKKDTPYNTYTRTGLPPTPIAMPSEGAILAVLNPSETDYLFFVAKGPDPKDGHYFSSTLKEHNRAVKQYRKAVQEYKRTAQDKKAGASSLSQNQDILVHEPQSNDTAQSNSGKQETVSGKSAVEFKIQ